MNVAPTDQPRPTPPNKWPPYDLPPDRPPAIEDLDDLVDIDYIGERLGYKRGRIREFMRGIDGKPPLPHVKIGRVPFFSKSQVAWWINQLQQQVDPVMVDIRRATREQDSTAR